MATFGETLRNLRVAQELGLREAAQKVGISPAYLSRIERGKERPPRPEVIKSIARVLAADPDVLFRLSSTTDPELVEFLHDNPQMLALLRHVKDSEYTQEEIEHLTQVAVDLRQR